MATVARHYNSNSDERALPQMQKPTGFHKSESHRDCHEQHERRLLADFARSRICTGLMKAKRITQNATGGATGAANTTDSNTFSRTRDLNESEDMGARATAESDAMSIRPGGTTANGSVDSAARVPMMSRERKELNMPVQLLVRELLACAPVAR
jgi:hypothetical protein